LILCFFLQWKRYENEPIAIVGMSCRMPESNNVEEYWKLLLEGRCAVRDLPEGRWTKEQSCYVNEEHRKVNYSLLLYNIVC
jgi:acyl transferase domain-containing protein